MYSCITWYRCPCALVHGSVNRLTWACVGTVLAGGQERHVYSRFAGGCNVQHHAIGLVPLCIVLHMCTSPCLLHYAIAILILRMPYHNENVNILTWLGDAVMVRVPGGGTRICTGGMGVLFLCACEMV